MQTTLKSSKLGKSSFMTVGVLLVVTIIWAAITAARSNDPLMQAHASLILLLTVIGGVSLAMWAGMLGHRNPFDESEYEDTIVKFGVFAAMFWGLAGFLVGVIIALQLTWPSIFYFPELGWTNFGRLRPLHTSAVIFAFGGNVLIATSFYVVQRTCRTRLAGGVWPWFVFWGFQMFVIVSATGYLMGITQSKEYAEP